MSVQITAVLLALSIVLPFGYFYLSGKRHLKGALAINITTFFAVMIIAAIGMFSGMPAAAEGNAVADSSTGFAYIAAALVTGLATIGAGIAVAAAAAAALGAISENEKIMGKALIFVALAEGIALYGLLVSFMILGRLG